MNGAERSSTDRKGPSPFLEELTVCDGPPPETTGVEATPEPPVTAERLGESLPPPPDKDAVWQSLQGLVWEPTGELAETVAGRRRSGSLAQLLEEGEEFATGVWRRRAPVLGAVSTPGRTLIGERYEVIQSLGVGGMGRLLQVRHLHMDREFALKIIHDQLQTDPRVLQSFFAEARVASAMEHPNIVQVFDFGVDPQHGTYIVMELLKGETLSQRIAQQGSLRPMAALDVALQVAEALHYIHQREFIHCDIKPDNVFLLRQASGPRQRLLVKLIDFGLCRRRVDDAHLAQEEVAGTPHYMAPEQFHAVAPVPAMDIYALGAILYEMLGGRRAYEGTPEEVMRAKVTTDPPPLAGPDEEPLDEHVVALVRKLMARSPEDRHQSMGQVIYQLRTLLEMQGGTKRVRVTGPEQSVARARDEDLRIVFETCPCPLFLIDREGRLRRANPAFSQFVRLPIAELTGRRLDETLLRPVIQPFQEELDALVAAGSEMPFSHQLTFRPATSGAPSVTALFLLVPYLGAEREATAYVGVIHYFQAQAPEAP